MISRYTEINKYGGYTWQIKIDSLFHLYIHSSNKKSCIVEFKEWKGLWYKKHFTFIVDSGLISAVEEAFNEVFNFFLNNKNYYWSKVQKNEMRNKTLHYLSKYVTQ